MSDDTNTPGGGDEGQNIEDLLSDVPGGSYILTMLQNNPEARAALENVDRNDPESVKNSLRVLLGAFGITGPQAEMMMGMANQMMANPESAMEQMQGMGGLGSMFGGAAPPSAAPAAPAPAPPTPDAEDAPKQTAQPEPEPDDPPVWDGVADDVVELIDAGSERTAFELMTRTLDDPETDSYDPRDDGFAGLTAVLEVFAAEAKAAGRQIPLRFGELYRRLAMSMGHTEPCPDANPAFTDWCAQLVEEASRPD